VTGPGILEGQGFDRRARKECRAFLAHGRLRARGGGGAGLCLALLHRLYDFWLDCRGASDVPNRDAFDPFNLRPWLGHISIYEMIQDGADFRIRLEGTSIVAMTGEDWTGRRASDVDRRYDSRLVDFMRTTIRTHQPAIHTMRLFQNDIEYITRLLLPIRSRPLGPVDQVFLVMYADPQPRL
jgi:hypothetical protein